MFTGVQFTGTLGPNASNRWFTFNWPSTWHVLWTVMPTTPIQLFDPEREGHSAED